MAHPTPHEAAPEGTGALHGAPHTPNGDQSPPAADKPSGGRIAASGDDCTYCFPDEHRHPADPQSASDAEGAGL